ncbi:hypothetical protein QR680_004189 [Steinernema hermaphroditum]|uniref:PB1 domain-containing protein n=1 Tax=Steinernema hermaphroditum TaxID=289476 RepID=A0AA39HMY1_9BILA|nr:hypothetical protein QR680_004189 [Steinernema hermaphroditum]
MKFFGDHKIHWIHFGKKHKFSFSKEDVDSDGLFEILMRKVKETCPDFGDLIAYNDLCGRQIILRSDTDLRTAIHQAKGKLKIYTTVSDSADSKNDSKMNSAEPETLKKPKRSQSVPPMTKPSLDLQRLSMGPRQSRLTVGGEPQQTQSFRRISRLRSRDPISPSSDRSQSRVSMMSYSPSYSYGPIPMPRPVNYGYPPPNFLLGLFLTGGHLPFYGRDPFLGIHQGFGGWNGRGYYNTAWGPVF